MMYVGTTVFYKLSEGDAEAINRRRTTGEQIASRLLSGQWPAGAQAHIGAPVLAGDVYPALVVHEREDVEECGYAPDRAVVSLRVFLNGTDELWVPSAFGSSRVDHPAGTWTSVRP